MRILTSRMELIAGTPQMLRAEMQSHQALATALGATIPDAWPPGEHAGAGSFFVEQIELHPHFFGWLAWYGVVLQARTLVGSVGFKGIPEHGRVELGYSVLEAHQNMGYASEMVRALVDWAHAQGQVDTVVANAVATNGASIRVLTRNGFAQVGGLNEYNELAFENVKLRS